MRGDAGGRAERRDPLEAVIEAALEPGRFVDWREMPGFVGRVDAAGAEIGKLIEAGDPLRAARLLETFLAACQAKADQIDDSDGSFGDLAGGLAIGWVRCRQAGGADPEETVATLYRWMAADEYGFFNDLATHAIDALDAAGLDALVRQTEGRRSRCAPHSHERRSFEATLKAVHVRRDDLKAYEALAHSSGGPTPADCGALASILMRKGEFVQALAWIDRGLSPRPAGAEQLPATETTTRLPRLRREVLARLGRTEEAVAAAWEEYRKRPSRWTHEELFRYVPEWERAAWSEKAVEAAAGHADLHAAIEILTITGEVSRLAARVGAATREQIESISHTVTEPAAYALAAEHPAAAAKVRTALALRVLAAKKTEYYADALRHLETARDLLLALGRVQEWRTLVGEIRDAHHRKSRFMPGFERIVSGWKSSDEPTFLERAKERWERRTQTTDHGAAEMNEDDGRDRARRGNPWTSLTPEQRVERVRKLLEGRGLKPKDPG